MKRTVHWLVFGAFALAAAVLPAAQAHAQSQAGCGPFNPNCVPSPFERRPFNPSYCSPSSPHACTPRWGGALGQDLQLTIQSSKIADYVKPDHDLDTIADLFAALRACWEPPEAENKSAGMQMSVRISFKRGGEMFGHPRLTYATPGSSSQTRQDPPGTRSMLHSRAVRR